MSDSFFTARNQVDPQVKQASAVFCNELVEAATRRLIDLEGPLETAKRLQRIADICAGAYVLPVDHWRTIEAKAKSAEPKERLPGKIFVWLVSNPAIVFWAGFAAGIFYESTWS